MAIRCRNWPKRRATCEVWVGKIGCMSAVETIDMSAARSNVVHMPKMIQVRNVPDEMHTALKVRAAEEGMTLSDYIKRELSLVAGKSTIEEIAARRRQRVLGGRTRSKLTKGMAAELIREGRGE